jgi:prepilin-type processing-associated H-X9-DG protein/prepilin-type N-terminal cleavage/methylation domain-containing protein
MKWFKVPGRRRDWRRAAGFTLIELTAVAAIVASVPQSSYTNVKNRAKQMQCMQQLQQIGKMLVMHQLDNETYPKAAFYPKDPLAGDDSLRVILTGKKVKATPGAGRLPGRAGAALGGGGDGTWICPGLPEGLQKKGLSFVYNDTIGGKRRVTAPSRTWVLIELSCVSKKAPMPHPAGYNILFADGHVITSRKLPKSITANQKAQIKQLWKVHRGHEMAQHHQH